MNERCPACGAANPDQESLFCAFCGGQLDRPATDAASGPPCPQCGTANDSESRFCYACGASLPLSERPTLASSDGEVPCPSCAAANPADARFCFQCGAAMPSPTPAVAAKEIACSSCQALNPDDARFCLSCGEPIPEDEDRRRLGAVLPFGLAGAGGGLAGAAGTAGLGSVGAGAAPAMAGAGASLGAEALAGAGSSALAGAGAVQTGAMAGAGMAQSGMVAGAGMAPSSAMAGAGALESPTALAGAGAASPSQALGGAGATSVPPTPQPPAPPQAPPAAQPPPTPQPPPAAQPPPPPQPPPAAQPGSQPQVFRPGGYRRGVGRVFRVVAFTSVAAGTLIMALAVLFALLMFTGDPEPCVTRTSTPSAAAVASAAQKWEAFKAAGPGATVAFNEQEATSRGVAYLEERDVPMKNLQVYFCPDGSAEVKGKVGILGRDVNVLFRGRLDVSGGKNRIVVDSVDAGNLPSWVGTRVVNEILDRNNARDLPLGLTLTSSTSSDGIHTLKK